MASVGASSPICRKKVKRQKGIISIAQRMQRKNVRTSNFSLWSSLMLCILALTLSISHLSANLCCRHIVTKSHSSSERNLKGLGGRLRSITTISGITWGGLSAYGISPLNLVYEHHKRVSITLKCGTPTFTSENFG